MAYDCSVCGHPDWAHSCGHCIHCLEYRASHEFTIDKQAAQSHPAGYKWEGWRDKEPASGLSPYQHELSGQGNACSEHCPACAWVKERAAQQRIDLKMPPKAIELTAEDRKFLADLKVTF
jgi:hypothetical protein